MSSIVTPGLDESRSHPAVSAAATSISSNVLGKLEEILGELQFIKQTISVMDERLTLTEDRVSSILSAQRGFGAAPPHPVYTIPPQPPTAI
jgi:DNA repair ATPase RecN